jgi:hypothetical protein
MIKGQKIQNYSHFGFEFVSDLDIRISDFLCRILVEGAIGTN